MCSILQNKSLWQGSNKKVHKQLEELNFLLSFCFVVLNVVIFNMATLTSGRNEKVICFLWLLSGCSMCLTNLWLDSKYVESSLSSLSCCLQRIVVFSLLMPPENCCLLSPIGSRELLSSISYWIQRIVVFSLLSAPENFCVLSPIGSIELLSSLSYWLQRIVVFCLLLAVVFSALSRLLTYEFLSLSLSKCYWDFTISTLQCMRDSALLWLYNVTQSLGFSVQYSILREV